MRNPPSSIMQRHALSPALLSPTRKQLSVSAAQLRGSPDSTHCTSSCWCTHSPGPNSPGPSSAAAAAACHPALLLGAPVWLLLLACCSCGWLGVLPRHVHSCTPLLLTSNTPGDSSADPEKGSSRRVVGCTFLHQCTTPCQVRCGRGLGCCTAAAEGRTTTRRTAASHVHAFSYTSTPSINPLRSICLELTSVTMALV
jgi:hypothetical protein